MRERVESVDGKFKVLSAKGAGSLISASLPLKDKPHAVASNSFQPFL